MSDNRVHFYINDTPDNLSIDGDIAIDTEAMGLVINRDRLCLIQFCDASGKIFLIHFPDDNYNYTCTNFKKIICDKTRQKIFHYARFDVAIIKHYLKLETIENIYCTKIASRLTRTYTDSHSLRALVSEICNKDLKKDQCSSNWGACILSDEQKQYAMNDVIFLHRIRNELTKRLNILKRFDIASRYFNFIDTICTTDLMNFNEDLFRHT